jgi:glutamate racemase
LIELPIGVFDSGVGGLTVLHALEQRLPNERFLYLGDTARLPYGTKSPRTVQRYAMQAAQCLVERGIKALVVACNTASAVALPALASRYAPLPVIGVVEPGADTACAWTRTGCVGVIATESTIAGGAYQAALLARRGELAIFARPCSLLVGLAEEGWTHGEIVESICREYLAPWLVPEARIDTLVLGCTHFPLLAEAIGRVVGERMALVDSAATTAEAVVAMLSDSGLVNPAGRGGRELLATDDARRFARVGSQFLGEGIEAAGIEIVDL